MRKIIFLSIVLIGWASNVKSQSVSKAAKNREESPYISLLAFAGNRLFDELKKRFNLTNNTGIQKEETSSGTKINYNLETKNKKIKVSGSFTRK